MNSSGNWRLKIRSKVVKAVTRFPRKDRDHLLQAIEGLPHNPYAGDIEKVKGGEQSWRRRIGSYRIFYEVIPNDRVIYIFRIERRTSKTY